MASLDDPRVRDFLAHGTRTGKLAFLAAGGRPLVAPVWFIVEGDSLVFNTHRHTAKGRALARDPRASLCVDEEEPPYAFVQVQGEVELSEDPAELVRTATAIAARYMGAERAGAPRRRIFAGPRAPDQSGLIRTRPDHRLSRSAPPSG